MKQWIMTGSSSTRRTIVFYSKDYRKVKILHYDINGWVLCSKWFTDGKFLKPLNFRKSKLFSKMLICLTACNIVGMQYWRYIRF
ncbi:IS66 family insertion sequence element accessory protein TnpB [Prevotella copri]|uniref:IS66 family insertion sequence element accessory protein TnpB n=1 Tax=Segatella copri TaxID=165179 RepID=UPI0027E9B3DC|nr:IS66 family insertion sequence element accessory protein TnpB [Segatella copri]